MILISKIFQYLFYVYIRYPTTAFQRPVFSVYRIDHSLYREIFGSPNHTNVDLLKFEAVSTTL